MIEKKTGVSNVIAIKKIKKIEIGDWKNIEHFPPDIIRALRKLLSARGPKINPNTAGEAGISILSIKYPAIPATIITPTSKKLLLIA